MSAIRFSGKTLAAQIYHKLAGEVATLRECGLKPHLAIVQVGDDEAAALYASVKRKAAEKIAISTSYTALPKSVSPEKFSALLAKLSSAPDVHAILVEAPLAAHLRPYLQFAPEKDVDGASLCSTVATTGFAPCTAMAAMAIIRDSKADLDGANAVVIGRSSVVGKPLARLLLAANATVTICHSHTNNLPFYTSHADLLIAAAGKPNLITAAMVREGAVLIDIGTTQTTAGLIGDFHHSAYEKAAFYTPVPGGVGPVTTAILLSNVVKAAQRQAVIIQEG